MEFISPVTDGIKVHAALQQEIHAVVDRDEAGSLLWKVDLRVLSHLKVFPSQTPEILDYDGRHMAS